MRFVDEKGIYVRKEAINRLLIASALLLCTRTFRQNQGPSALEASDASEIQAIKRNGEKIF